MIVRELLTVLGWDVDEKGANQYDRRNAKLQTDTERTIAGLARTWEGFGAKVDRALSKADAGLAKVESTAQGMANSLGGVATMLMGGLGFAHFANITSEFTDLHSRLKVATEGTVESADKLLDNLNQVALRTFQDVDQTVESFLQLKPGLDQLGLSTEEQTNLLQSLNDAMTVGGIKGEKAGQAMMWLGRSFTSGKISLEAFNNLLEGSDDLVVQWSKNSGKTVEQLRAMAKAGKLTSRWLADHYLYTMEQMRLLSEEMPVTINDAVKRVTQTMGFWIYRMDRAYGVSKKLANMFLWLADRPYIGGMTFFTGMGIAALAMAAQIVASIAAGGRAIIGMIAWLKALTRAQLLAAATNPFVWVAAAIVGMQDLLRWVRGDVSQIGRLIGTLAELEATPAANRKWWQNWALGVADYTKNVDAASAATQTLFANASNPPPDQSWSAWFKQLGADADKALFGAGGWADWSPITINEGGKAAKAIDWLKGKFDQLATEAGAAWETLSAKLSSEIGGAVANVQASWSSMVDGAKSAFGSAVDFMIAKWGELKAAVLDNAVVRGVKDLANKAAGALGFDAPFVENGGGTPIVQPDGKRAGGGPVNRGGLYLVGEEGPELVQMGGSGFVTPAPQTRTVLDSWLDRTGGLGGRMAAGVAAAGVALSPVAAAAGTTQAAQQAAMFAPAGRGGVTFGDINAPTTVNIERGAIPDGVSVEQVVELIDSRAGAAAERDCRNFRVWTGIVGSKEIAHGSPQGPQHTRRAARPASGGRRSEDRVRPRRPA